MSKVVFSGLCRTYVTVPRLRTNAQTLYLSLQCDRNPHPSVTPPILKFKVPDFCLGIALFEGFEGLVAFQNRSPAPGGSSKSQFSKSQIAARCAAVWHAIPQSHWPLSFQICALKSQRFKSQRLQDANTTKSTLAFYKSQRFSHYLVPLSLKVISLKHC